MLLILVDFRRLWTRVRQSPLLFDRAIQLRSEQQNHTAVIYACMQTRSARSCVQELKTFMVRIHSSQYTQLFVQDHVQHSSCSFISHPLDVRNMLTKIGMVNFCLSHPLLIRAGSTNLLYDEGWSLPCPEESSSSSSSSVFVFWLVTAQEHVVMQRPMPSPEQAISTQTSSGSPGKGEKLCLLPAERNPSNREREREREREKEIWLQSG